MNQSQYVQETDTKFIFPSFKSITYSKHNFLEDDQTIGDTIFHGVFPISTERNIIDDALNMLYQLQNRELAKEAMKLLFIIQQTINKLQKYGFNLDCLPPLSSFLVDDGSIIIEWIFQDARIGFCVEQNGAESSWYLVTNSKFGDISASGYVSVEDNERIVIWLINFIVVHY